MGYSTWTVDGYGVCMDSVDTTVQKIDELLKLAPIFSKSLHEDYLDDIISKNDKLEMDDFEDWDDLNGGIATLLQSVIREAENIEMTYADDYNDVRYLLYTPSYPWSKYLTKREKTFSQEDVTDIFKKYVNVLTEEEIKITYYSVENGG